jgi:hypothetical protein
LDGCVRVCADVDTDGRTWLRWVVCCTIRVVCKGVCRADADADADAGVDAVRRAGLVCGMRMTRVKVRVWVCGTWYNVRLFLGPYLLSCGTLTFLCVKVGAEYF